MCIMDFTVEEINLIAIYNADTKAETLQRIAAALPFMDDDMRTITESATRKLTALSSEKFTEILFTPADDTDEV